MAEPYGKAIWQGHMARPYGRAIWQSHMAAAALRCKGRPETFFRNFTLEKVTLCFLTNAKKNRLKILYRTPYLKNRDLFSRTNFDHFLFSWFHVICVKGPPGFSVQPTGFSVQEGGRSGFFSPETRKPIDHIPSDSPKFYSISGFLTFIECWEC